MTGKARIIEGHLAFDHAPHETHLPFHNGHHRGAAIDFLGVVVIGHGVGGQQGDTILDNTFPLSIFGCLTKPYKSIEEK